MKEIFESVVVIIIILLIGGGILMIAIAMMYIVINPKVSEIQECSLEKFTIGQVYKIQGKEYRFDDFQRYQNDSMVDLQFVAK